MIQESNTQSNYNFLETDKLGRAVLYNSKTGKVIVPPPLLTEKFLSVISDPGNHPDRDYVKRVLVKHDFIVSSDTDELMDIKKLHDNTRIVDQKDFNITIIPTEHCNFACPYCFVYKYNRPSMTDDVYDGIYNSILGEINQYDRKKKSVDGSQTKLCINWFGGEPTLESKKILWFMDRMIKLEKSRKDICFYSTMTTNGYLLNYDLFAKFVRNKICRFQVTLDGNKNLHDNRRYLRGSRKGTFDVIYNNLLEIRDKAPKNLKFNIVVRSNFAQADIKSMTALKNKFMMDFGGDNRFSNYFARIFEIEKKNKLLDNITKTRESEALRLSCFLGHDNDAEYLDNSSIDNMYRILPQPKTYSCFTDGENRKNFLISVRGALFSCCSYIGKDDEAVGRLHKDGTMEFFKEKYHKWKCSIFDAPELFQKCFTCKLLPVCMGGCRQQKMLKLSEGCCITEKALRDKLRLYLARYTEREKELMEK